MIDNDSIDALEQAANLAVKLTAAPRDYLGPATDAMKTRAALGEKIAAAIRALHVTALTAAATTQPAVVPDGWRLVPAEPNDAMQAAGAQAVRIDTTAINKIWTGNAVFRAMLAAAPATPAIQGVATPHAVLYAALDMSGLVVYSHENLENVEMNSGYIKTPTRIVGLAAIAARKAAGSAP